MGVADTNRPPNVTLICLKLSYVCPKTWRCRKDELETVRDLSEISRGAGGGKKGEVTTFLDCRKGRGHEKWAVKRERVMQICVRDHVEAHPQKKKRISLFFKKQPGRNRRVE